MANDIRQWLEELELSKYGDVFVENDIELDLLAELSNEDLKDIGVASLGHRRRLLRAIAQRSDNDAAPASDETTSKPEQRSTAAERRQLTVMFCDLVGSTALSQQLDPEDLRDVMRLYQDAVTDAVERFGGHVAKYLGDGVLAYFGWPQAYEDQAERAVRAGLRATAAVREIRIEAGGQLAARVGIDTGQVVVGDLIGASGRDLESVSGETPNLAARLQGVADPGQVVVGEATHHLVGQSFAVNYLGQQALKGFDHAMKIWSVSREIGADSRFDAAHAQQITDIVGRDTELQLLLDRWHLAEDGEGQAILISGEAGIGKSRLIQGLHDRLANTNHTRIRYQCSPHHTNSALYPTIQQLQRAAGFAQEDDGEAKLDKLEVLLRETSEDLIGDAPLYANLLSLSHESRYGATNQTPQQIKERLLEALIKRLVMLAERRPVLFLFEDTHWIDPTSQELLERLVGRLQEARILLIIAHRPEWQENVSGHNHVTSLRLNRMSKAQGYKIIQAIAGHFVPDDLVKRIIQRTDGIPLFIEELTKTLVEGGLNIAESDIPATLQASLLARIDRLGPQARKIAQIGAVIGREFQHKFLAAVAEIPSNELEDGLAQLVNSDLVFRVGAQSEARYSFKHALVQDAAYQALLKRTRQRHHRRVAELIETQYPDIVHSHPELVAHHYTEAGLSEPAIVFWQRAGTRAMERSANVEAISQLSNALELLGSLPDTIDRDHLELNLQLALGAASIAPKSYAAEEVRLAFQRADELCQKVGDVDHRFQAVKGLWNCHNLRGEMSAARDLAMELSNLAEDSREPDRLLMAQRVLALTHLGLGEYKKSLDACERGIEIYDPDRQTTYLRLYGEDPGLFCYVYCVWTNYWLGYPDVASARADQALELAKRLPSRYARSYVLALIASFFLWQRRLDEALECAYAAHEVAEEQFIVQWRAWSEIVIGNALTAKGQLQEGLNQILKGRDAIQTIRARFALLLLAPTIAEVFRDHGKYAEGLEVLEEAKSTLRETSMLQQVSEIYRLRGNLLEMSGAAVNQTEAEYLEALDVASTQEAKMLELRTATDQARLWQHQSKIREAYELLTPIYNWFTEGFDTQDLIDAKALLDECARVR